MKRNHIGMAVIALTMIAALPPITYAQDRHDHIEKKGAAGHAPGAEKDNHGDADHHDAHDAHGHGDGHADEVKLTANAVKKNGISVSAAAEIKLTATFVAPARVAFNAEAMAHIGSVVGGRATEIKAKVGDRVKQGDVLVVVESPDLGKAQSEYLQRSTEAEIAAAAVNPAKEAYERARKLYDGSQGIALSEVQKREAEHRSAVGAAASAKASLQAAENALHLFGITQDQVKQLTETKEIQPRFEIRSPIAGQIVEREVTLGELVSPEKEKLLVVADTSTLWLLADIPEARLADVEVGSKVEVQVAALPNRRIEGEVSLISSEVDPNTRTACLRIVVQNENGKLRPGMFARTLVHAATDDTMKTLVVPDEAVQTVEGKTAVFVPVEGEPNTFAKRNVVVGKSINGYAPIVSGLKTGEQVVVAGSFILKAELGKSEAGHDH